MEAISSGARRGPDHTAGEVVLDPAHNVMGVGDIEAFGGEDVLRFR